MVMTTMTTSSHIGVYARERIITLIWGELVMLVMETSKSTSKAAQASAQSVALRPERPRLPQRGAIHYMPGAQAIPPPTHQRREPYQMFYVAK